MLTWQDIKRLTKGFHYRTIDDFLDSECLYVTYEEEAKQVPWGPAMKMICSAWCLKRYPDETGEEAEKGHPLTCRFLTDANLCSIYPYRPIACRIWPYITYIFQDKTLHAMYIFGENCTGFYELRHIKEKHILSYAIEAKRQIEELEETVREGILKIHWKPL